jgi:hypothetical protein
VRGQVHKEVWWSNLKERDYSEDKDIDGMIILKWIFKKYNERAWT